MSADADELEPARLEPAEAGELKVIDAVEPPEEHPVGGRADALGRDQHLVSALIAAVAGAGLVAGSAWSPGALIAAIAVLHAVLIWAWAASTRLPGQVGAVVLGVAAAASADVVVMVWPHGQLGSLVGVLAFVQIGAFLHQLSRGVARAQIVTSLGQTELLIVAVIAFSALVPLRHANDGRDLCIAVALAAGTALVEGHLVDLAWTGPRFDSEVRRGLLAAAISVAVSGAITYAWLDHQGVLDHRRALILGVSVGIITSLFAVAAAFVLENLTVRARLARPFVAVLLPLALLAPVAYVLGSAVQG
jgi:hypothetical protein